MTTQESADDILVTLRALGWYLHAAWEEGEDDVVEMCVEVSCFRDVRSFGPAGSLAEALTLAVQGVTA
jgi:hypothetical protein